MAQVFGRWANPIARIVLVGAAIGVVVLCGAAIAYVRAPGANGVGIAIEQPVPFSHKHHVGGLGIDCRYCHTSVERSAFAGLPPTETCMTCHSQLWTNAAMLAPVRTSLRDDEPLRWNRVNNLPDYVYFNHSIHIAKGVACETCHGRVDQMSLMSKGQPLSMGWCLDCHRDPAPNLRPKEDVFDMGWKPPAGESQRALGSRLVKAYHVHVKTLTHCSVCHR